MCKQFLSSTTAFRSAMVLLMCLSTLAAFAADPTYHYGRYGGVDYTWSLNALHEANVYILVMMQYMLGILYAVASVLSIYSATVIYIKIQAGEEGFVKAVLTLVGSVMFLIGATIVMPAFFGIHWG